MSTPGRAVPSISVEAGSGRSSSSGTTSTVSSASELDDSSTPVEEDGPFGAGVADTGAGSKGGPSRLGFGDVGVIAYSSDPNAATQATVYRFERKGIERQCDLQELPLETVAIVPIRVGRKHYLLFVAASGACTTVRFSNDGLTKVIRTGMVQRGKSVAVWTVEDVAQWVRSQTQSWRYEDCFRDNRIAGRHLGQLSLEQLRDDLGIRRLGDRLDLMSKLQAVSVSNSTFSITHAVSISEEEIVFVSVGQAFLYRVDRHGNLHPQQSYTLPSMAWTSVVYVTLDSAPALLFVNTVSGVTRTELYEFSPNFKELTRVGPELGLEEHTWAIATALPGPVPGTRRLLIYYKTGGVDHTGRGRARGRGQFFQFDRSGARKLVRETTSWSVDWSVISAVPLSDGSEGVLFYRYKQADANSGRALLYSYNTQTSELGYRSERRMSGWRKSWSIITPVSMDYRRRTSNTTAVVVLGFVRQKEHPHPPTTELRRRVETGVREYMELQAQGLPAVLVLSGGNAQRFPADDRVAPTEADCMRDVALELGVPHNSIFLERQSAYTIQNAIYVQDILQSQHIFRLCIVTSEFHRKRARIIFERWFSDIPFAGHQTLEQKYTLYFRPGPEMTPADVALFEEETGRSFKALVDNEAEQTSVPEAGMSSGALKSAIEAAIFGHMSLSYAVKTDNIGAIKSWAFITREPFDSLRKHHASLLHYAAYFGALKIAAFLLTPEKFWFSSPDVSDDEVREVAALKADVNALIPHSGVAPIHYASFVVDPVIRLRMVSLLITHGANPHLEASHRKLWVGAKSGFQLFVASLQDSGLLTASAGVALALERTHSVPHASSSATGDEFASPAD